MIGRREAFEELNTGIIGSVKFVDGYTTVNILGCDMILFKC